MRRNEAATGRPAFLGMSGFSSNPLRRLAALVPGREYIARTAVIALLAALVACGVAISGRVEVGEHVGTTQASPCPGATE